MGRDDYSGTPSTQQASNNYRTQQLTNQPGQNVEMESLTGNGAQFGRQNDPNAILNECKAIGDGITDIEMAINQLETIQLRVLSNPDTSSRVNEELDSKTAEIMNMFRNFTGRMKNLKQKPESGSARNAPQIGNTERRLKGVRQTYQQVDANFQRQLRDQMARQYRIVRPEASAEEVREAVEDTSNQQVFSQALMQSSRRGQAQSALNAVENRHQAIAKIERQMIELAELFQDMENLVVQQEAAVTNIEMKGEEVVENMDKGTEQIGVAIKSARNARKWKWWCLGICGMLFFFCSHFDLNPHCHSTNPVHG
jgi:syntaxin 1B/2/3